MLGLVVADEHDVGVVRQRGGGVGVDLEVAVDRGGHDGAPCGLAHAEVAQRTTRQLVGDRNTEHIETFGQSKGVVPAQGVPDGVGPGRGVGEHGVGAGSVQGGHVPVEPGSGDDLDVGPEPPTVDGEVHVHIVVVGGDHDRRGVSDPCVLEHLAIGGIADDGVLDARHSICVLLDDAVLDPSSAQRPTGGPSDPPAAEDDHGPRHAPLGAVHLVVAGS